MKENCKKTSTLADGQWVPFARLETIPQRDKLIEGYCIPLDGKQFRIFVADETTGTQRGYFLKLMYEFGTDEVIDLDKNKNTFPETTRIFKSYLPKAWINRGTKRFCYKYIMFGHGLTNKHLALSLMHGIIASIAKNNGGQFK